MPTHITLGRSVGLDEAKIAATGSADADTSTLSPVEQTVIEYARRLTRVEPIDDELFARLREHFTLEQLMELCFTIGVSSIINRFHATFHTPLDERTRRAFAGGAPLPLPPQPSS